MSEVQYPKIPLKSQNKGKALAPYLSPLKLPTPSIEPVQVRGADISQPPSYKNMQYIHATR